MDYASAAQKPPSILRTAELTAYLGDVLYQGSRRRGGGVGTPHRPRAERIWRRVPVSLGIRRDSATRARLGARPAISPMRGNSP